MHSLRDRWRRAPIHQYFADMAPIDRATAIVVLVLLLAGGIAFSVIIRSREPALNLDLRPSITFNSGTPA